MRLSKTAKTVVSVCFGLTAAIAVKVYFENSAREEIQAARSNFIYSAAREINSRAPVMIDDQTRLDSAEALSNHKILVNYTLPETKVSEIDLKEFRSAVTPLATNKMCASFQGNILKNGGYIFSYKYRDKNGATVAIIDVRSDDCK